MKILIDTNVIMDVLFARDPFISDSVSVLHRCEDGLAEGYVSAKSLADIYYFLKKYLHSEAKARATIRKLLDIVKVCDVTEQNMIDALDIDNSDYEDAILAAGAKAQKCKYIITRNKKHFLNTGVKCLIPSEFV